MTTTHVLSSAAVTVSVYITHKCSMWGEDGEPCDFPIAVFMDQGIAYESMEESMTLNLYLITTDPIQAARGFNHPKLVDPTMPSSEVIRLSFTDDSGCPFEQRATFSCEVADTHITV